MLLFSKSRVSIYNYRQERLLIRVFVTRSPIKVYNRFSGNARKFSTTRSRVEGCASVFPSQYRNISPAVTISRTKMDRGTWNMVIRLIMHSISPASVCAPRDAPRSLAAIRSNRHWNLKRGIRVSRDISLLSWRFVARGRGVFFTAVSHLSGDLKPPGSKNMWYYIFRIWEVKNSLRGYFFKFMNEVWYAITVT